MEPNKNSSVPILVGFTGIVLLIVIAGLCLTKSCVVIVKKKYQNDKKDTKIPCSDIEKDGEEKDIDINYVDSESDNNYLSSIKLIEEIIDRNWKCVSYNDNDQNCRKDNDGNDSIISINSCEDDGSNVYDEIADNFQMNVRYAERKDCVDKFEEINYDSIHELERIHMNYTRFNALQGNNSNISSDLYDIYQNDNYISTCSYGININENNDDSVSDDDRIKNINEDNYNNNDNDNENCNENYDNDKNIGQINRDSDVSNDGDTYGDTDNNSDHEINSNDSNQVNSHGDYDTAPFETTAYASMHHEDYSQYQITPIHDDNRNYMNQGYRENDEDTLDGSICSTNINDNSNSTNGNNDNSNNINSDDDYENYGNDDDTYDDNEIIIRINTYDNADNGNSNNDDTYDDDNNQNSDHSYQFNSHDGYDTAPVETTAYYASMHHEDYSQYQVTPNHDDNRDYMNQGYRENDEDTPDGSICSTGSACVFDDNGSDHGDDCNSKDDNDKADDDCDNDNSNVNNTDVNNSNRNDAEYDNHNNSSMRHSITATNTNTVSSNSIRNHHVNFSTPSSLLEPIGSSKHEIPAWLSSSHTQSESPFSPVSNISDAMSEDLYEMSDKPAESSSEINKGEDFDIYDDINETRGSYYDIAESIKLAELKNFYIRNECLQSASKCGKWQRNNSNKSSWVKIKDEDVN
jgi:hypothetical protein